MPDYLQLTIQDRHAIDALNNAASVRLADQWLALERKLRSAIDELIKQARERYAAGETVPISNLMALSRYQSLLVQLQVALNEYAGRAIPEIEAHKKRAIALGQAGQIKMLKKIGLRSDAIAILPDALLLAIAEGTAPGAPLNELVQRAWPTTAQSILNELAGGILAGVNPRHLASNIRRQGLTPALDHILLIARDQGVRSWRESGRQQMLANGVQQYRRTAARQRRTCAVCLALDGTIYDTAELMPLHPQCRCALIPIVQGYPVPRVQSGADWFDALPEQDQRDILGPRRLEQYQAGRSLADMVQIKQAGSWGQTPVLKPLR